MGKTWIERLKTWFLEAYDKEDYKKYRDEIKRYNIKMLNFFNVLVLVLLAVIFISGFFTQYVASMQKIYLFMAAFTALEMVLDRVVFFNNHRLIDAAVFLCMTKIYLFCIISGVSYSLDMPAVSLYVFMIVLSILFLVRPWKLNLYNFLACMAFCMFSLMEKPQEIASADLYNCWIFYVVAAAVSFWIVKLRIGFIRNEKLLTIQRDTDILTTLPNRRSFNDYLKAAFEADRDRKLSILMMDIDHFKSYNDSKGHIAGDYCLETIGKALDSFGRENGIFFARYGGEEFVAVDTKHRREELEKIADGIVHTVYEMGLPHEGSSFKRITISVGFASRSDTGDGDPLELLEMADQALYAAKQQGRNKISGYQTGTV